MNQSAAKKTSKMVIVLNKIKTYFSKPQNIILLLFGIVLTFTTVAPIVAIVEDTFKIHPGTIDAHLTGKAGGYSVANYVDLFTSKLARTNLWTPLLNTVLLAVFTCLISILFGGLFAFLITRTNLKCKKYLSSIFTSCRSGHWLWDGRKGLTVTQLPEPPTDCWHPFLILRCQNGGAWDCSPVQWYWDCITPPLPTS